MDEVLLAEKQSGDIMLGAEKRVENNYEKLVHFCKGTFASHVKKLATTAST